MMMMIFIWFCFFLYLVFIWFYIRYVFLFYDTWAVRVLRGIGSLLVVVALLSADFWQKCFFGFLFSFHAVVMVV